MERTERQALKKKYQVLRKIVDSAIRHDDPMGLLEMGSPSDEYDPEVGSILPRLKEAETEDQLCSIVHEEFLHWFGDPTAGPKEAYRAIAQEIWKKYHATKGI
jgi:hypothetical protein